MINKKSLLLSSLLILYSGIDAAIVKIKNAYNPNSYLELSIQDEGKMVTGIDIKKALYKKLFDQEPQEKDLKDFIIIFAGTIVEDEDPVPNEALNGEKVLFYRHPSIKENYQQYNPTPVAPENTGFMAYLASLWNRI